MLWYRGGGGEELGGGGEGGGGGGYACEWGVGRAEDLASRSRLCPLLYSASFCWRSRTHKRVFDQAGSEGDVGAGGYLLMIAITVTRRGKAGEEWVVKGRQQPAASNQQQEGDGKARESEGEVLSQASQRVTE